MPSLDQKGFFKFVGLVDMGDNTSSTPPDLVGGPPIFNAPLQQRDPH